MAKALVIENLEEAVQLSAWLWDIRKKGTIGEGGKSIVLPVNPKESMEKIYRILADTQEALNSLKKIKTAMISTIQEL